MRISPRPAVRVQAMGRDGAGRWQYRYHESHVKKSQEEKFQRVVSFARALPKMRRRVNADLRKPGLGRDKVLACILRILGSCFIRSGSQQYAEENGSFGLATLRRQHVKVVGDTVHFDFPGKSGKQHQRQLRDKQGQSARQAHKVAKRTLVASVKETAEHLGNTPAVAKASYISARRRPC